VVSAISFQIRGITWLERATLDDYWRGIILFGRNVASYKFALGKALLELRPAAGYLLKLEDLAGHSLEIFVITCARLISRALSETADF